MTVSDASLIFDVVLSVLLAVMIFYAVRLNGRILTLRERETEMQAMIEDFNHSSAAAHASASALKSAGTEAEFAVKAAVARAMALRNDLELMIDQGGVLVERIDSRAAQHADLATPRPRRMPEREPEPEPAIRPSPESSARVRQFSPPVRPASDVVDPAPPKPSNELKPRTEAERQLLEAIRAAKEGVA